MVRSGDRVRPQGVGAGQSGYDIGTVRAVWDDQANVFWHIAGKRYQEHVDDLELTFDLTLCDLE